MLWFKITLNSFVCDHFNFEFIFVSGDDVDAIALEVFNELNRLSEAEKKQDIKNEQADWTKTKRKFLSPFVSKKKKKIIQYFVINLFGSIYGKYKILNFSNSFAIFNLLQLLCLSGPSPFPQPKTTASIKR